VNSTGSKRLDWNDIYNVVSTLGQKITAKIFENGVRIFLENICAGTKTTS